MKKFIIFLLPVLLSSSVSHGKILITTAPFPVFLKYGFSSVLEFEETPQKVVLGDSQSFQVEKLNKSLVIKSMVAYASSNMFVYFENADPKLFILTASEDAEPTYYKKFESPKPITPPSASSRSYRSKTHVRYARFDSKKDYLTVEVMFSSFSNEITKPNWDLVRLRNGTKTIAPDKLWSERKEIQKDSNVKARFIFAKPNLPRNLSGTTLVIPLHTSAHPITLSLAGTLR